MESTSESTKRTKPERDSVGLPGTKKPKQITSTSPSLSLSSSSSSIDKLIIIDETEQLPAIKLVLDSSSVSNYASPLALAKEIVRCHPSINKAKIKFATIKDKCLIIATDDAATHNILSGTWQSDAFEKGLSPYAKPPTPEKKRPLVIRGVHLELDLQDQELIDQLAEQGLASPTRILAKNRGDAPTSFVKVEATTHDAFVNAINNRVKIGFSNHRAEAANSLTQCFNCQKVGHTSKDCANQLTCLKCGGKHRHKECQAKEPKCANCKQAHVACYRRCPYLRSAAAVRQPSSNDPPRQSPSQASDQQQQQKSQHQQRNHQQQRKPQQSQCLTYAQAATKNTDETVNEIRTQVVESLKECIISHVKDIINDLKEDLVKFFTASRDAMEKNIFDSVHQQLITKLHEDSMSHYKEAGSASSTGSKQGSLKPSSSRTSTSTSKNLNTSSSNESGPTKSHHQPANTATRPDASTGSISKPAPHKRNSVTSTHHP